MLAQEEAFFSCPYCGEFISVLLDPSLAEQLGVGDSSYVEDCQVCCRPMVLDPRVEPDGSISVTARAENE